MSKNEEQSRVLNMEEKRKLEKLLVEDVEEAKRAFNQNASCQRSALVARLQAKPPAKAQALFLRYENSRKAMEEAEGEIEALGWHVSGYGERKIAVKTCGILPLELAEFEEKVEVKKAALASLTRTFTLKLFARGAEAETLFADLAKHVSKLVS